MVRLHRGCRCRPRCLALASLLVVVVVVVVVLNSIGMWLPTSPPSPGPAVRALPGSVWPRPAELRTGPVFFEVLAERFQFQASSGPPCPVLDAGLARYTDALQRDAALQPDGDTGPGGDPAARPWRRDPAFGASIVSLDVRIGQCEDWPHRHMDESYRLVIERASPSTGTPRARLSSPSVWGALRGMETFSQLLRPAGHGYLLVNATEVVDAPRFPHRGLLLDTGRHFLPVEDLKLEIDALEVVKMNVLHWHIVDDQSFPWQSQVYPELSQKGAYHPSLVYRPRDVQEVLEHARLRGVRVMVELDTPGHTRSWGEGRPGLLASCQDGTFANIDPTRSDNLAFLQGLFQEAAATFPEAMLHVGGDEVPDFCWNRDPSVQAYMKRMGYAGDYRRLQAEYMAWLTDEVGRRLNKTPVVWQEALQHGDLRPEDGIVVHVWSPYGASFMGAMRVIADVTRRGFQALYSYGWYLDILSVSWRDMYRVDPQAFHARNEAQRALVQGGEACLWGEMADATNLHSRVWPRAAAVAERLWTPRMTTTTEDEEEAAPRIEQLVCRLNRRAVPASPANGPGFCPRW